MRELIQLFTQIALLRKGPQDVPASPLLLALTVLGYVGVNALVSLLLPPMGAWPVHLLVDVLFTLAWYFAVLRLVGKPERTLQTLTAVFGFQAVLSPLLVGFEWVVVRLSKDAAWATPIMVAYIVLVIWMIAANSHVVKNALDWSGAASVALVILQIVLSQLVLLSLFPISPA